TAFIVSGSHTYSANGRFGIHATVTDLGGSKVTATATVYVSSPGLPPSGIPVNAIQDFSFSGLVASFIDTDPNAPLTDFTTGNSESARRGRHCLRGQRFAYLPGGGLI